MKSLHRILTYVKKYWTQVTLAIIWASLFGIMAAIPPYLIQHTVDDIFIKQFHHLIIPFLSIFVLIFALKGLFMYLTTFYLHWVGNKIMNDIRNDLFSKVIQFPPSFFQEHTTGSLLSHFLNDIQMLQIACLSVIKDGVRGLFEASFLLSFAFFQNFQLACILLLFAPFIGFVISRMGRARKQASASIQKRIGTISSLLQEMFVGVREIKAFNAEKIEILRVRNYLDKMFDSLLYNAQIESMCPALVEVIAMSSAACIMYWAAILVIKGDLTAGQLVSFVGAVILAYQPLKKIASVHSDIQYSLAAADRIFLLMDRVYPSLAYRTNKFTTFTKAIAFDSVSFGYQETLVLNNVSFTINKGERIGIIGPSGSGKSTFADLLLGFLIPSKGIIKIDEKDSKRLNLEDLRNHIGYVGQHPFLFNETVYNNVAYGNTNANQEDIVNACKLAYAHEFIQKLESGYETIVGENGSLLSGGQKQRLTIARALLKKPSILIFDEATSALDEESERLIRNALESLTNVTLIIISHRPCMLEQSDRIFIVNNKSIQEMPQDRLSRGEFLI